MKKAPWVCRRCLQAVARPAKSRLIRFASSSAEDATISPALLSRARLMAAEYATLSAQMNQTFDSKSAKRAGELQGVVAALAEWERTREELEGLRAIIAEDTSSSLSSSSSTEEADEELRELARDDLAGAGQRLRELSRGLAGALTPRHPFAALPCLLEFRPGAGGGEANLFAGDLLRMYRAYCARRGLRASLLKYETADGGGGGADGGGELPLAEAILEVEADGAYGSLRGEAGVHRVQRVPATESKGRTHTSAVSVLVLPSIPSNGGGDASATNEADFDDPDSDYHVDPGDVRTDVMRARGAGGQHVNTTDSAVRLTHLPTGTVVSMQETRSQHKNREKAWRVLRARLAQQRREAREEEVARLRRDVVGVARMGRGDKVRTYNWGQQRVTDHRSGLSVHDLDDVMAGGETLERVMKSAREWLADREVAALLAEEEEEEGRAALPKKG